MCGRNPYHEAVPRDPFCVSLHQALLLQLPSPIRRWGLVAPYVPGGPTHSRVGTATCPPACMEVSRPLVSLMRFGCTTCPWQPWHMVRPSRAMCPQAPREDFIPPQRPPLLACSVSYYVGPRCVTCPRLQVAPSYCGSRHVGDRHLSLIHI